MVPPHPSSQTPIRKGLCVDPTLVLFPHLQISEVKVDSVNHVNNMLRSQEFPLF